MAVRSPTWWPSNTSATDDDCPTALSNLRNARKKWARMSRIIGQEGANARMYGKIFKVVLQALILFDSETWVVTLRVGRMLGFSNSGWTDG